MGFDVSSAGVPIRTLTSFTIVPWRRECSWWRAIRNGISNEAMQPRGNRQARELALPRRGLKMKLFEQRVAQIMDDESKHHPIHAQFFHDPVIRQSNRMGDRVPSEQERCQMCHFSGYQAHFIPRLSGRSQESEILKHFSAASWV